MARATYERLSAQDATFLLFETPQTPMNVGGAAVYSGGTFIKSDGGVDLERIKQFIASRLHAVPRYRQRLAFIPLANEPVWIDDPSFDLDYHVHHVALPRPGDAAQLQRLTAEVLAQPLDRGRPLWETWVVEGLPDNRFALISKTHHCMVDGVSGVDLAGATMGTAPRTTIQAAEPWRPRRPPSGVQLLRDDVLRRAKLVSAAAGKMRPDGILRTDLTQRLNAVWHTVRAGLHQATATPLNQPIGSHRRFGWVSMDLAEIKQVKNTLGGSVNDVLLAVVSGAVRRLLQRRHASTRVEFRVAVPVNVRTAEDRQVVGNRVSVWLMRLPIEERDARRRLAKIRAATEVLKRSQEARGTDTIMRVLELTGTGPFRLGTRFAKDRMHPYNLMVTNVPGPQFPLYMLDAQVLESYLLVPLFESQGLGIALFSYLGRVFWGLNADRDLLPDLAELEKDIHASFVELHAAAVATQARS